MYTITFKEKTLNVFQFGAQNDFGFGKLTQVYLKDETTQAASFPFDKLFIVNGQEFYLKGGDSFSIKNAKGEDINASALNLESDGEERLISFLKVVIPDYSTEKEYNIDVFHFGIQKIDRCSTCVTSSDCEQWCGRRCSWLTWACYK